MSKTRAGAGNKAMEEKAKDFLGGGTVTAPAPAMSPVKIGSNPRLAGVKKSNDALDIEIARLEPDPDQPRKEFPAESIDSLAASLLDDGQLLPIRVRWDDAASVYRIIDGERRWRAAKVAGLSALLCVVDRKEYATPKLRVVQLVANLQREDLSPMDQARQIQQLMEDHGYTQVMVSSETKIERTKIVRLLSLLNLPGEVQEMVETGAITTTTAHEISKAPTEEAQVEVARAVIGSDLSRAETADEVKKVAARLTAAGKGRGATAKGGRKGPKASRPKPDLEHDRVFNRAGIQLKVESKKGFNLDQLLSLLEHAAELVRAEKGVESRLAGASA